MILSPLQCKRVCGLRGAENHPANKLIIFQLAQLLKSLFVKSWKTSPRVGKNRNRSAELEEGGVLEKKETDGSATALVL